MVVFCEVWQVKKEVCGGSSIIETLPSAKSVSSITSTLQARLSGIQSEVSWGHTYCGAEHFLSIGLVS